MFRTLVSDCCFLKCFINKVGLSLVVPVTWNCYIYHYAFFCSLSTTTTCSWLAITCLSVWIWKSHRILVLLLSTPFGCIYHFDFGTCNPYLAQMFLYTILPTCLWHSIYAVHACILQPATMPWTVSEASVHSAPWLLSGVAEQITSVALVLRTCFWAATISASVLSFRPAFCSHWQDFSISATSSICLWYIQWRGSSFRHEVCSEMYQWVDILLTVGIQLDVSPCTEWLMVAPLWNS